MSEFKKYRCLECEHLYDEAKGRPLYIVREDLEVEQERDG